jgi:hypothetical protein
MNFFTYAAFRASSPGLAQGSRNRLLLRVAGMHHFPDV